MKKLIYGIVITISVQAIPTIAKEGSMCSRYYEDVKRKENNIKSYGSDLSQMAKNKLFQDLKFETRQCISECEGHKFKYCNEITKWISK